LGRIAAGCFAHAGINGVTRVGQSTCSEGAKATRRVCDENNVLHESLLYSTGDYDDDEKSDKEEEKQEHDTCEITITNQVF
jgi:hypothetical protein